MTPQAPAGVHPVIWLILFLLIGPPALLSKTASGLPGLLGAAGRWWQSKEPATASYRVSQSEIHRIQGDYDRLSASYKGLVEHNVEQDTRMDGLERELTEAKTRYWAAIGYIRRLIDALRRNDPDGEIPIPPPELSDINFGGVTGG